MKVHDGKNVQQAVRPKPQNKIDKKGGDFKKILSEAQSKIGGSPGKNKLSPDEIQKLNFRLQNAGAVNKIEGSDFSEHLGKSHGAEIKKVEKFLDLMESYVQALSDPQKNLREIAPIVKSLESEKEKLVAWGESLPEDNILKHIVNQTVILSAMEVLRFNRGDYL